MSTKTAIIALIFFILGAFAMANRQIEYQLPPAFACHGEDCFPTYRYKTNYETAFANCNAALVYQLNK